MSDANVTARRLIGEVFGGADMPDSVMVCNAVRGYADESTYALLIVRGRDGLIHRRMEECFEDMGAVPVDPEVCLPLELRQSGVCTIRPDSVSLDTELFSVSVGWGETSAWWTDVALASGDVYAGLLHPEVFDALAERTRFGLALKGPLPPMLFIRMEAQAA